MRKPLHSLRYALKVTDCPPPPSPFLLSAFPVSALRADFSLSAFERVSVSAFDYYRSTEAPHLYLSGFSSSSSEAGHLGIGSGTALAGSVGLAGPKASGGGGLTVRL